MVREYIIGRSASSAVKVPLDKNGVSGTHAKISIGDNGAWMLCDLDSTNGTYVSDDLGVFHRIYSKAEQAVLCLRRIECLMMRTITHTSSGSCAGVWRSGVHPRPRWRSAWKFTAG